jgi:hypothetical protein
MSGRMELELELGLKGKLTNASIPFLEGLPNNSNAKGYGGILSVFLERKVHGVRLSTRYRKITRMRESH